MGKLDETKEKLNTLRVFFTIVCAMIVATISGIMSITNNSNDEFRFLLGVFATVCLVLIGGFILHRIKVNTNEIKDL